MMISMQTNSLQKETLSNSNKELVDQIQNGDAKAFEQVFKENYAALCGYARKYVYEIELAEEIVQSLFLKLWEKRETIAISTSLKSYLFRSVHNNCINHIKHEKIKSKHHEHVNYYRRYNTADHSKFYREPDLEKRINDAIESLPKQRKRVFKMSRQEGLKYREIAEKMGISIKTVEVQMGKALQLMREELKMYL